MQHLLMLAAWKIGETGPQRLAPGQVELEKHLEDWIAADPTLVDRGLLLIQRQLHVDGGFLDLLCVDLQGRATVIEIKRGRLIRDTIAQALDYASSIAAMPTETLASAVRTFLEGLPDHPGLTALLDESDESPREVSIVVVGVGAEPGLERMIDFLGSRYEMPIRAVTYDVFALEDGSKMLVREETEPDAMTTSAKSYGAYTAEAVLAFAGGAESVRGKRMLKLVWAAEQNGLHARPYKYSFMFTPPSNRNRYLMTVWRHGSLDELRLSFSADAFAEFFPVTANHVRAVFGDDGSPSVLSSEGHIDEWVRKIGALFASIETVEEADGHAG